MQTAILNGLFLAVIAGVATDVANKFTGGQS